VSQPPAIVLNNISKCFKRYGKPIDRLKEALQPGKSRADEFWALRDINLEIERGETYGIIGQNGSGKSTLLQIIAGTLTPTSGTRQVNGRISALLELGSGFNPEFTGRQNVFLNGQILGLSQMEVANKFDDIAAFANIGQFIDQPVKSYSSGMMVRLAFAVAINVEPEILIVDEALSVGDVRFQARCMKRIRQLKDSGVTILFVSHDASSVKMLCNQALLLNHGEQVMQGKPNKVVDRYVAMLSAEDPASIAEELKAIANRQSDSPSLTDSPEPINNLVAHQHGNQQVKIEQVQLLNNRHQVTDRFNYGEVFKIQIRLVGAVETEDLVVGISIRNLLGVVVYGTNTHLLTGELLHVKPNEGLEVSIDFLCQINRGSYTVTLGLHSEDGLSYDWVDEMIVFEVHNDRKCDGMVDLNAQVFIASHLTNPAGSIV
jgi:lipopolysaccharide transport system ATP-binding protein